jgi:flagellum-specific peptidoglycan hydrolase FlgJ
MKSRVGFWKKLLKYRFLIMLVLVVLYGFGRKNWYVSWSKEVIVEPDNLDYFEKYGPIAVRQMKIHGIPASIILAQGYLESGGGLGRLALNTNNHFGLKCFSKSCAKGHCINYEDDSHKDFFLIFERPELSYEEHSRFLKKDRYKSLFLLDSNDFEGWAKGLKRSGYATDPRYDQKLIQLIKRFQLDRFDHY